MIEPSGSQRLDQKGFSVMTSEKGNPASKVDPTSPQQAQSPEPADFPTQLNAELDELFGSETSGGDPIERAHGRRPLALAFSGGGIRSATFNLGVIQALAKLRLLSRVDYLSTVSGGGYIGSWLANWIKEADHDVQAVEKALDSPQEPAEIVWLRNYSNYLTPRTGPLSLDTLQGVATIVRNIFLNQLSLVAFLSVVLLLPWTFAVEWRGLLDRLAGAEAVLGAGFLLLAAAAWLLGASTAVVDANAAEPEARAKTARLQETTKRTTSRAATLTMLALSLASLLIAGAYPVLWRESATLQWAARFAVLGAAPALYLVGWLAGWGLVRSTWPRADKLRRGPVYWGAVGAGVTLATLLPAYGALMDGLAGQGDERPKAFADILSLHVTVLGPPLVLLAILAAMAVHLGFAGRSLPESLREWWGRLGGALLRVLIAWLALATAAIYSPYWIERLGSWAAAGGLAWLSTAVGGALAGASANTGAGKEKSPWLDLFARVAPLVFVVGLTVGLSYGVYRVMGGSLDVVCSVPGHAGVVSSPALSKNPAYEVNLPNLTTGTIFELQRPPFLFETYAKRFHELFENDCSEWLPKGASGALFIFSVIASVCRLVLKFLGSRVDINYFSLHMFYRNRLTRSYLGAARRGAGDDYTGLDPDDAPLLHKFKNRPFHIVNATLNITQSDNLAWQERKAASFTFTRLFCGYEFRDQTSKPVSAYAPTADFGSESHAAKGSGDHLRLAGPMTISGAAVSPNSGYHTSPATAFLMTMFNVRLGWWLPNPGRPTTWRTLAEPRGFRLLLRELSAHANSASSYVYLSDGGNFENLGIYELVRRRCGFIIACDAGCDPDFQFEDLGNAIRKIRVDLGVEIEIDPRPLIPEPGSKRSLYHCVVGRIRYDLLDRVDRGDPAPVGYLLYLKPTLCGAEPGDVAQYAAANADFPHQPTADQWFAESQFEAYRKLGEHIVQKAFVDWDTLQGESLETVFRRLGERWHAPSLSAGDAFSKYGDAVNALFSRLSGGGPLTFFDKQFFPQWRDLENAAVAGSSATPGADRAPAVEEAPFTALPTTPKDMRACFYFCNELFQLMENVYHDLNLETESDHPDNRGWMNLFRNWCWSPMFRVAWSISASSYGARFQVFCERHLKMGVGDQIQLEERRASEIVNLDRPKVSESGSFLNPIEWDIVKALPESWTDRLSIVALRLEVGNPLASDGGGRERIFDFPVGFALVQPAEAGGRAKLKFFRIQDHLQQMGLAARGLSRVRENFAGIEFAPFDEKTLERIAPGSDARPLRRLWNAS